MKDNYLNNLDMFKQVEKGNLQFNNINFPVFLIVL